MKTGETTRIFMQQEGGVCLHCERLWWNKQHRAEKLLEPRGGYQIWARQVNTRKKKKFLTKSFYGKQTSEMSLSTVKHTHTQTTTHTETYNTFNVLTIKTHICSSTFITAEQQILVLLEHDVRFKEFIRFGPKRQSPDWQDPRNTLTEQKFLQKPPQSQEINTIFTHHRWVGKESRIDDIK